MLWVGYLTSFINPLFHLLVLLALCKNASTELKSSSYRNMLFCITFKLELLGWSYNLASKSDSFTSKNRNSIKIEIGPWRMERRWKVGIEELN